MRIFCNLLFYALVFLDLIKSLKVFNKYFSFLFAIGQKLTYFLLDLYGFGASLQNLLIEKLTLFFANNNLAKFHNNLTMVQFCFIL